MKQRWYAGSSAWLMQRLSGAFLALFLVLHLSDTARRFGLRVPGLMGLVTGRPGRAVLLSLLAMHGLNGIRVLLVEAGLPTRLHKATLWVTAAVGITILCIGV